jgi:ABC transporter substrate binding protein
MSRPAGGERTLVIRDGTLIDGSGRPPVQNDALVVEGNRIRSIGRLPESQSADFAESGGLFAYGVSFTNLVRRATVYVDKILKGAKPGELPVEQATTFELVVNLRTANALRIVIPQSVALQADRMIE